MTWLDGGLGDDDEFMVSGARVFDLSLPKEHCEVTSFAGPSGRFFSDGCYLYSSDEDGLSRWDSADGAVTGRVPGFRPTHFHRNSREFVQARDGSLVIWIPENSREFSA